MNSSGPEKWVKVLWEDVIKETKKIVKKDNRVVSVGSGWGEHEKSLSNTIKLPFSWYCVDPNPRSFKPNPPPTEKCILPMFANVSSLSKKDPTLKRNCAMTIFWPSPSGFFETEETHNYDLNAIADLEPTKVLIVYDVSGAAGSSALHEWLQTSVEGINDLYKGFTEWHVPSVGQKRKISPTYKVENVKSHVTHTLMGDLKLCLLLLNRKDD